MARKRGQTKPAPQIKGDLTDPRGMARMVMGFIEWLGVRNYSQDTIRSRRTCLNWFTLWLAERGAHRPADVTRQMIEGYQRWLYNYRKADSQPLATSVQHHRLMAVKMFFRWLVKNNQVLYNPASEIELPKVERRLPKGVLSAQEIEQVINQADIRTPVGIRDRAVMETLYSTGMRRSELIELRLPDVDAERGTVLIRQGKGKRDRMVPIGERALGWLDKYAQEVRPRFVVEPDGGVIFLTNQGDPFTPKQMTAMVSRYVAAAGFAKRGSCHLFRHTCATLMLEGGADIRYIQELLGHTKLETTQIYTQVTIAKLKQVHTSTHPARAERRTNAGEEQEAEPSVDTPD